MILIKVYQVLCENGLWGKVAGFSQKTVNNLSVMTKMKLRSVVIVTEKLKQPRFWLLT